LYRKIPGLLYNKSNNLLVTVEHFDPFLLKRKSYVLFIIPKLMIFKSPVILQVFSELTYLR